MSNVESFLERIRQSNATESQVYGDSNDAFTIAISSLAKQFGVKIDSVLYPGSASHSGVAEAFGKGKVVHVDPDVHAMRAMAMAGYFAVNKKIEEYSPGQQFDLMVSYNSGTVEPNEVQRLLTPNGFIIANNWHGSANVLGTYDDFRLLGAVLPSYTNGSIVGPDEAVDGLGAFTMAVTHGGQVVSGDAMDMATMTIIEMEKNPDGLFVFQRVRS